MLSLLNVLASSLALFPLLILGAAIPRDLSDLSNCLTSAGIDNLKPSDPNYTTASTAYNEVSFK